MSCAGQRPVVRPWRWAWAGLRRGGGILQSKKMRLKTRIPDAGLLAKPLSQQSLQVAPPVPPGRRSNPLPSYFLNARGHYHHEAFRLHRPSKILSFLSSRSVSVMADPGQAPVLPVKYVARARYILTLHLIPTENLVTNGQNSSHQPSTLV